MHKHQQPSCVECEVHTEKIRLGKKLKIVGLIFIGLVLVSFLPGFEALQKSLFDYLRLIWWAILLGLLLGGLIDYFIPDEFIYKYLGGRKKRTLFFAVIAGLLLSACSHGILAIAIQLYKKGASIPAVITFLLASPWANLPVTILLFSFFGVKAIAFILTAMLIALITGFIFRVLERKGWVEKSKKLVKHDDYRWLNVREFAWKKASRGVLVSTVNLSNMVLWWILIGVMAAAIIGAFVPHSIIANYFGPTVLGLVLTLIAATVIEVCSEGSAPIAFEIFSKTGALGNPFVFLMAGVATDYTEVGLIWTNIGKRTAIWLPIIAVPQILIAAVLFNIYL